MNRERHHWKVELQREDGQVVTRDVRAYWNPEQETCTPAVGATAKAEAHVADSQRRQFVPIGVELVS